MEKEQRQPETISKADNPVASEAKRAREREPAEPRPAPPTSNADAPPAPRKPDPEWHRFAAPLTLVVEIALLLVTVLELGPHFFPDPFLVYAREDRRNPLATDVITMLRNPASYELTSVHLLFEVDALEVRAAASADAPKHVITWPSPLSCQFDTTGPMPGHSHFNFYLHRDADFLLRNQTVTATTMFQHSGQFREEPTRVLSEDEYFHVELQNYLSLAGALLLFLMILIVSSRFWRRNDERPTHTQE